MSGFTIGGIVVIAYGIASIFIAIKKPSEIWETDRIQKNIDRFGERGAALLLAISGLIAIVLGVWVMS